MSSTLEAPLPERILDATEQVLRRHGAEKTNVVDVARVLGMSHGNIYRHFPSKKALLDAVAARWLHKVTSPLLEVTNDQALAPAERLVKWFDTLRIVKQHKVLDDPELFRVYHRLAVAARELAGEHIVSLLEQVERIIREGMAAGEFSGHLDARSSAQACLHAMSAFHHPAMLSQGQPPKEEEAHAVLRLLVAGLRRGTATLPA